MTVYRRRVASSFAALRSTLKERLATVRGHAPGQFPVSEDEPDDETSDDVMDAGLVAAAEREAAPVEERAEIERLLDQAGALPQDTKAGVLRKVLEELEAAGYEQVMVFTQYTATMDFLREYLRGIGRHGILCFSGRGGEVLEHDGKWRTVSRDDVKRRFREGRAEILLCTDAAAEGLNFQFCGALVNYDMPWNPMRVEQRIGRIDRLGQQHAAIRIVNLHYRDTVEADVYAALRSRIGLFEHVVGRLHRSSPGCRAASRRPCSTATAPPVNRRFGTRCASWTRTQRAKAHSTSTRRSAPRSSRSRALSHRSIWSCSTRFFGARTSCRRASRSAVGPREYGYLAPGMEAEIRVTTDARFFEENAESVERGRRGGVVFPDAEQVAEGVEGESTLREIIYAHE